MELCSLVKLRPKWNEAKWGRQRWSGQWQNVAKWRQNRPHSNTLSRASNVYPFAQRWHRCAQWRLYYTFEGYLGQP